MTYSDKELLFISNLQTKLGNNILGLNPIQYNFNSKEFKQNREIDLILDLYANSRYNYVNEDGDTINYNKCKLTEDQSSRYIDFIRHRFRMGNVPFIDYPKRTTKILFDLLGNNGSTIPSGGGPNFYLTKSPIGELVWERIGECLVKSTFITPAATVQGPPYVFGIENKPQQIHMVFVNGVLLEEAETDYENGILTIYSPVLLDLARVTVYGGCKSLVFIDGTDIVEDAYTWTTELEYTFTTSLPIAITKNLFINGIRYEHLVYYNAVIGDNEFTIDDEKILLEEGDRIVIRYKAGSASPVDPDSGIFDYTFDDSFE